MGQPACEDIACISLNRKWEKEEVNRDESRVKVSIKERCKK